MVAPEFPPRIAPYVVSSGATLEEAMLQIDENAHRSVVVVEGRKALGVLSDGDVRKAILDRRLLSTPVRDVMNVNFISLARDRVADAAQIFARGYIFVIPVVDGEMALVDILTAY